MSVVVNEGGERPHQASHFCRLRQKSMFLRRLHLHVHLTDECGFGIF